MCEREQRGIILAATKKIRQKGEVWIVPSSTGLCKYTVVPNDETPHCSCPDHEATGKPCKHIFAVRVVIQRELFDDGSVQETQTITIKEVKKTYPQNWRAYNAAQVNEKEKFQVLLKELCKGIEDEPRPGRGRPKFPLADGIFAAVFKTYSTVSGRRFISDLRNSQEKGYINRAASYNYIFKLLEQEETTEVLTQLLLETANPLVALESHFSCDSSGFSSARFDRWFDHKWGDVRCKRAWTKAHIMIGTNTQVITAVEIHGQMAGDSPQLIPLMESTAKRFSIQELSADLAYSTEENLTAITAIGADPLIPFKKNATSAKGGIWAKMFHYFQFNREEFMGRYHHRSKIESTFSMIKRKFGDGLRSKTDIAMKNETLCKFICHNICVLINAMHELDIDPVFWNETSAHKLA